jgi:hypothetical protein
LWEKCKEIGEKKSGEAVKVSVVKRHRGNQETGGKTN